MVSGFALERMTNSWLHADDLEKNLLNLSWFHCSRDDVAEILRNSNENQDQEDHSNFQLHRCHSVLPQHVISTLRKRELSMKAFVGRSLVQKKIQNFHRNLMCPCARKIPNYRLEFKMACKNVGWGEH